MPYRLQLEHHLPFAIMGDAERQRLEQCVAAGVDFVIEVYKPSPDIAQQLPAPGYIAYVKTMEPEPDAQDTQAVD